MRKALLFLAIVVCGTAFAQQAQSKVYCEIVGTSKMFSKKLTIEVDFGQESTLFSRETLVDENGKPIVFNSMVDAMNYMGTLGWEFEQAYVVTVESGSSATNVYHWLFEPICKPRRRFQPDNALPIQKGRQRTRYDPGGMIIRTSREF